MNEYILALQNELELNADPDIKKGKEAYMRNKFPFYGIPATSLKEIAKPFLLKAYRPEKTDMIQTVKELWQKPEREYQYFAQELTFRYVKNCHADDILLYEFMITHRSWWDTVDFIANKLVGAYLLYYPDMISMYIPKWLASDNIWLQRTAVIFQLKYKEKTDTTVLRNAIVSLLGSKEFFINKAIGWALREYSKTNPEWVTDFVKNTDLSSLSEREALRLIKSGS